MIKSMEQAISIQQKRVEAGKLGFSNAVISFIRRQLGVRARAVRFYDDLGAERCTIPIDPKEEAKDKLPYLSESKDSE